MMHPATYLLLLVLFSSAVSATTAVGEADGFIYNGFSGADLSMDNAASVTDDGLLRLTNWYYTATGHAFHTLPLDFSNPAISNSSSVPSFSTTFVFAIVGSHDFYDTSELNTSELISSDGLAFVLSSKKELFGAPETPGYLGLVNSSTNGNWSNHLLAIELDTVQNFEFGDINENHIGIDVNSLISNASKTAGYYNSDEEFQNLSLSSGKPMQVWVDYDSKHTILNVTIAPCYLSSAKPNRPLLSVRYDLSSVLTNNAAYAGFSSTTGKFASNHYILGWSFQLNGEAAALDYSALSFKTIQDQLAQLIDLPSVTNSEHYKAILYAVLLPTALGITMVLSAFTVKVLMNRMSKSKAAKMEWEREYGPPSFTYKDLLAATSGFKDKMLLGREGFGSVFKGVLPHSKQTLAIKLVSPESKQGMKEFIAEIAILGHLRHHNLVQLLGYCRHKQQLLLVYDYMPNGSLDCHLHTHHHNTNNLFWAQRFHIIKGIASGLFYLHEDWEQVVIHRDIKASNVLLDSEMNARLGDFGLARSHDHGADAYTTRVAGTWGYIAPELARLGKATKATDVFAFGVLMMEVACGRRPIWVNTNNGEPLALGDWVLAKWQGGSITDAVDPRLDDHVEEEIELVLKLGLLCSHPLPNVRPSMRLVVQYLHRDAHLPSELEPNSLLNIGLVQDEMHEQQAMSCPVTVITDLSKGR